MRIEIREDRVLIDGYVNAVGRDSRPISEANGGKFVEQIVPGAFRRAIEQTKVPILLLLNHDEKRELGSTKTNLALIEDNIGLRAICEITDVEVVQKAREKKLRGWSFAFYNKRASEEDTANGMKRRFVEEMDLKEVSIIDERKLPCYAGTSIHTRADGAQVLETRAEEFTQESYTEEQKKPDLEGYKKRIESLEGRKGE